MAFTAKSVDPELKYITPATTRGVICEILSAAGVSNDHRSARLPTFEALISSRED
jgi:hypothetical protein